MGLNSSINPPVYIFISLSRETQVGVPSHQGAPQTPHGGGGGPQSIHAVAYARAQHLLGGLDDGDPEPPSAMPNLLQFDRDINEIFKPIKIPELK